MSDLVARLTVPVWPGGDRRWQTDAYATWLQSKYQDFLTVAWPSAGKTRFAIRVIHSALESGEVELVIVVVPTTPLRKQWSQDAAEFGIHLDYSHTNDRVGIASDFHGIVVTYSAVASQSDLYRAMCRKRVLVILDEPHHMQDDASWGKNVRNAFEKAWKRLLLSGTPWRTDGKEIPFVVYDEDGVCVPSFVYGYADALTDGVSRPLYFPTLEGRMTWKSGIDEITAEFADDIAKKERGRRLRTALMEDGDWVREAFRQADAKLTEVRNDGHRNAGGLVICMDGYHAKKIAALIKRMTGTPPVLVLYDEEGSHDKITEFEKGTDRWIVAVRMVSEGVDIKRLRVLLYATNVITELFFDQAIGRIIRMIEGLDYQAAFCYIPADPELIGHAQAIMKARDHFLRQVEDRERRETSDFEQTNFFVPLSANDLRRMETITTNGNLSAQEIEFAEQIKQRKGWNYPAELLVEIYREMSNHQSQPAPAILQDGVRPIVMTRTDEKAKLKKRCHVAVGAVRNQSGGMWEYWQINDYANTLAGVEDVHKLETWQLEDRLEFLQEWRRAYAAGTGQEFDAPGTFRAITQRNAEKRRDRVKTSS